ncbi:serine/threonine-protein kinase/endoribonuclease IRE1a-like protein [Tanacetum coccineum]
MVCSPQDKKDIYMLLNAHYGGAKCLASSETIFVNGENGEIMPEESDNSFVIEKNSYEIRNGDNKSRVVKGPQENGTAKLAGLGHIEWLSDRKIKMKEYLTVDIFDFGKILLNFITDGKHGCDPTWGKDGDAKWGKHGDATWEEDLEDILEELPGAEEEVKDLLRKVLHKDYELRPTLQEILEHPLFCDLSSRIDLLSQVSDFCEFQKLKAKKKEEKHLRRYRVTMNWKHPVVHALDIDEGPLLFKIWKDIFNNKAALDKAMKHRTADYEDDKLTDLVRLFRNIMSHHTEYKDPFRASLGYTKSDTEYIFREKFPKFFMVIHRVAKTHLKEKFKSHFENQDVDFTIRKTQSLETLIDEGAYSVCSRLWRYILETMESGYAAEQGDVVSFSYSKLHTETILTYLMMYDFELIRSSSLFDDDNYHEHEEEEEPQKEPTTNHEETHIFEEPFEPESSTPEHNPRYTSGISQTLVSCDTHNHPLRAISTEIHLGKEEQLRREEQEKVAELRRLEEAIKSLKEIGLLKGNLFRIGQWRFSADYTPTVKRRRGG